MDNGRRICWSPGPLSSAASPAGRIPASAQGYPRCCPAGPVAQRRGTRSKDEGHNRVALRWAAGSPCSSCFRWRAMESDRSPIVIDSDPADPNKQFRKFQGAGPVAGEVTDIAVDPQGTEDQIIYISTNDGGIWKSTDGGTTWNPKTDGMPSLSMGAVAIDPTNSSTVYAGTGNLFDGGGVFSKGVGLYKSTDAGETWAVFGGAVL